MSKNLDEFISYLEKQIGQPYLWGGQHTKLTPENYISVIEDRETDGSYDDGTSYVDAVIEFCEEKFDEGKTVLFAYDCSGLGAYWLQNVKQIIPHDANANSQMYMCSQLDTPEPPEKGWWVFRTDSNGKAVHVGYMVDNTHLIEAKGRKYGVVKTEWKEGDWDCWGIPKVFKNDILRDPETHPEDYAVVIPLPDPEPKKKVVKVIKGSVNVRASDERNDKGKLIGKILFVAHKGKKFDLIDVAPSGWYHIETYKGPAYITNRNDLTRIVEK